MNASEVKIAEKLLADRCDRTEACGADTVGGWCLTAYWLDGGQRLFYTMAEVRSHIDEH